MKHAEVVQHAQALLPEWKLEPLQLWFLRGPVMKPRFAAFSVSEINPLTISMILIGSPVQVIGQNE